jgi:hypothetical protein
MSTVVHINRLKRAHVQKPETSTFTNVPIPAHSSRVQQKRKKSKSDRTKEDSSQEIPPGARVRASVDENNDNSEDVESLISDHMSSVRLGQDDPEWKSSSLHLQRTITDDSSP